MYKLKKQRRTSGIKSVPTEKEALSLERKIALMMENKEKVEAEAPEIYTARKDGVLAGMDIRTDRWEIAADAASAIERNAAAKRQAKALMDEGKDVDPSTGLEIVRDEENKPSSEGGA